MLLLVGPPGSGKTHSVLEQVREELTSGRSSFRLLVPTATMAEHVRHLLAREGFVFRPSLISTLSNFIEPWMADLCSVSAAALDFLIEDSLARLAPAEFRAVSTLAGFRSALAASIEELSSAGCPAGRLARVPGLGPHARAFQEVYEDVEKAAAARGMALGRERLGRAAARIRERGLPGVERIFFDGFFGFADPELEVIDALRCHAGLTITLPSWQGAGESRARLAALGFSEKHLERFGPRPEVILLKAQTQAQELEEIAARVLERAQAGHPFREIGIVVRTNGPYVPALRATLERFDIPARFYFAAPLADHSVARSLTSALDAMPGNADDNQTPAEWVRRVKSLRTSFSPPRPVDPATHDMVAVWRGAASALDAFDKVVVETASAFPPESSVPLSVFCQALKAALRLTPLRVPDRRRNVVQVMDAYEARQWELPVVFVCGLLEKQSNQDPILADGTRWLLRNHGVRVATAAERDQTERFLFEIAATRATETLVLSYPQFNQKGEETLRSFDLDRFLETAGPVREGPARSARPEPRGSRPRQRRVVIFDEALRQQLAEQHAETGPTALEVFLQCPFKFFAKHTLKLEGPPPAPEQRLDASVQGNIVHTVLARWLPHPRAIEPLFESVFRETCARETVPEGYRTEAVRLELLRNLRGFTGDAKIPGAFPSDTERDFTLPLDNGLTLRCRIDRIDSTPGGKALIIDYKYSSQERIAKLFKGHDEGTHIQGGIYILAVQNSGREVAGMHFAGIRGEVAWAGWEGEAPLREVMAKSRQTALEAIARVRDGVIAPDPADRELCQYCDFRDACRVESVAKAAVSGEATEWT
jgi:ATP-dependent helicase/DNAse subunit B